MSLTAELSDSDTLAIYRAECNRLRTAIEALADTYSAARWQHAPVTPATVACELRDVLAGWST